MAKTIEVKRASMEVMKITEEDTLIFFDFYNYYVKCEYGILVYSTEDMGIIYGEDIFDKIDELKDKGGFQEW